MKHLSLVAVMCVGLSASVANAQSSAQNEDGDSPTVPAATNSRNGMVPSPANSSSQSTPASPAPSADPGVARDPQSDETRSMREADRAAGTQAAPQAATPATQRSAPNSFSPPPQKGLSAAPMQNAQTGTRNAQRADDRETSPARQDPSRLSDKHGVTDRPAPTGKTPLNLDAHNAQVRHDQDNTSTPQGKPGPTRVAQRRPNQKPGSDGHVADEHRPLRPAPMNTPAKASSDPRRETHEHRVADEGNVHASGAFAKTTPHPADEHRAPKMTGGVQDPRTANASAVLAKPDRTYEDEGRTRHPKDGFGTALDVAGPSSPKAQPGSEAQQATLSAGTGVIGQPTPVGGPVPVTARPDSAAAGKPALPDKPDSASMPEERPDSADRAERDTPRDSAPVEHVAAHDDVGGAKPIR